MHANLDRLVGKKATYTGSKSPRLVVVQGWVVSDKHEFPQIVFSTENGFINMDDITRFKLDEA